MAPRRRRLRRATRRRIKIGVLVVAGLGLLVGVAAGFRLFQAGRDLRTAERLLNDAGTAIEDGRLAEARQALAQADARLVGAAGDLHNHPELDVVRALPVLGDNLVELRRSVALANQLTAGGLRVLTAAQPLEGPAGRLEVPLAAGAIPLRAVQAAQREAELLAQSLPELDEIREDPPFLFGPVQTLHDKVFDEAERRIVQLDALVDGLALVAEMAGGAGDRLYLIAVANTAEMRGSGGMILNYGALVGKDGDFELVDFERIDGVRLEEPIDRSFVPSLPEDYLRRWEGFDPLLRWRNANLAADFTVVAPVLESMFGAATGVAVDGVIQIDPVGLAAILEGVGPVEVPELGTVGVDNLVPLVLHEAYIRFRAIDERSDVLRDVAEAAFRRLVEGSYPSLRPLGEALIRAVDGRHVLFHARDAGAQERIRALGADGSLPDLDGPDAVHLTVQNVAGNKLDYFVDTEVALSGALLPARPGSVRAEVVVSNTAPEGVDDPPYIYGPFNDDQVAGLYRGVVTLYLPRGATVREVSGDPPRDPPHVFTEDGRPLVSYTVDLPAGATSRVAFDITLPPRPDGRYELLAVPSPRIRPTVLRTDLDLGDGGRLEARVTLDRPWRLRSDGAPQRVPGDFDEDETAHGAVPRRRDDVRRSPDGIFSRG
ncbi:MAG: DUF4012 domain-containing protein [Acidimicrobiales bacterium]|nr:DUF4012 domain-containing protein [Acidimicrobiales bacterium]